MERDQINYLTGIEVSAVNISSKGEVDRPSTESGSYSLVFGSPDLKCAFKIMKDGQTEMLCSENTCIVRTYYVLCLSRKLMFLDFSRLRINSLSRIECHFPILSEPHIKNSI